MNEYLLHPLLAFFTIFWAYTSSPTEEVQAGIDSVADSSRVLIVYVSRTHNTKAIAEIIQKNVGGALVALELEKPYPANYQATVQQVATENETGYLPPLQTKIANLEQYQVVVLGFPTWGMQLPPPMKTF